MKAAPLFTCMLAGGTLLAQATDLDLRLHTRANNYLQKLTDTIEVTIPNPALVRGNRVVALPQDGMPCIVPDVRGLAPMPNPGVAAKKPIAGRMPSAWNKKKASEGKQ